MNIENRSSNYNTFISHMIRVSEVNYAPSDIQPTLIFYIAHYSLGIVNILMLLLVFEIFF